MHYIPATSGNKASSIPLVWFVALSLALHLLLLWVVVTPETPIPVPAAQQAAGGLVVNVLQPEVRQPAQPRHQKAQAQTLTKPQAKTAAKNTPQQISTKQSDSVPNNEAAFRERIQVKLQQALAVHFRYPLLARQRNWQGKVVLTIRVESDGRISEARVARSSGYGLLDHAALSALDQVGRLNEQPGHSFTLEFPVIYRLEG